MIMLTPRLLHRYMYREVWLNNKMKTTAQEYHFDDSLHLYMPIYANKNEETPICMDDFNWYDTTSGYSIIFLLFLSNTAASIRHSRTFDNTERLKGMTLICDK